MPTQVKHIAIIMDGNRRWAKQTGLSAFRGHQAGVLALENMVKACSERGIKYLTVYGFSTENWRRSQPEVKHLVGLFERMVRKYADTLDKNGWRLNVIGRLRDFPKTTQSAFAKSINQLKDNEQGVLTLALSYGGRDEMLRAVEKAKKQTEKLTEKSFAQLLDTSDLPDPELIIRTGGQIRLSNFMPWQSTYSELYFTKTFWPDFSAKHLDKALAEYAVRQRNFGQ